MNDSTDQVIAKARQVSADMVAMAAVLEQYAKDLDSKNRRDRAQQEGEDSDDE